MTDDSETKQLVELNDPNFSPTPSEIDHPPHVGVMLCDFYERIRQVMYYWLVI